MNTAESVHNSVAQVMTPKPIAVEVSSTIQAVVDIMYSEDIRHVPVVKDGTLVGMISDRDIKAIEFSDPAPEDLPDESAITMNSSVSEILQNDVLYVAEDAELPEVISLMIDHKIGAVPVVEEQNNTLVGIVSYIDILKVASEVL